jgi:hypothetical protein
MSGNSYRHPLKWDKMPKPLGDVDMPWLKVQRCTWDECWPWLGTLNADGYGVFTVKGRQYRAHRVAYKDATGVDPGPDLVVDHTCRNRACCNPRHMELVTLGENVHRSVHTLKALCVNGHVRDGDNLLRDAQGRRRGCRECERERPKGDPHPCPWCGTETTNAKHCSKSCSTSAANHARFGKPERPAYRPESARDGGPGCPGTIQGMK